MRIVSEDYSRSQSVSFDCLRRLLYGEYSKTVTKPSKFEIPNSYLLKENVNRVR